MIECTDSESMAMARAKVIMDNGLSSGMDFFQLTEMFLAIEAEKIEKQQMSDESIDYNDEIVEIEDMGELETIDISVTGDQLFYCNDILTKNSMGLAFTADAIFALVNSEELDAMGQIMIKQLKNRWGDLAYYRKFVIGIDRAKMKLFNLEDGAQKNIINPDQKTVDKPRGFDTMTNKKKKFDMEGLK